MIEVGYSFEELFLVQKNTNQALCIATNALTHISDILGAWKVRPADLQVALSEAQKALMEVEAQLKKNPQPLSTRKWLDSKRQGYLKGDKNDTSN
jgi:hypothetical protein